MRVRISKRNRKMWEMMMPCVLMVLFGCHRNHVAQPVVCIGDVAVTTMEFGLILVGLRLFNQLTIVNEICPGSFFCRTKRQTQD